MFSFLSMSKVVFLIVLLLSAGCVGTTRAVDRELSALDRNKIIESAKRELRRQNHSLPRVYTVEVGKGGIRSDFHPSREIYVVSFSFAYRGKKDVIYTVFVDKLSGKADRVFDSRTMVPSES